MKALVVYDSLYGNTAEIAKAIGGAISDDTKVLPVSEVSPSDLESLNLLIVGAPTHAGRPSPPMRDFLNNLPKSTVEGTNVAAFDTRLSTKWLKIIGYAAGKIAKNLQKKGGNLLLKAEPFYVTYHKQDKTTTLIEGELERAAQWAQQVIETKG